MTTATAPTQTSIRFQVNNAELNPALRRLSGIVDHAQVIQILGFVKCVLSNDSMLMIASNSEIEMHVRVAISHDMPSLDEQEIEFTLPCKKLLDISRTLPNNASIAVEQNQNWTSIRVGKTAFKLASLGVEGFPQLDPFTPEAKFAITEAEFLWLLRRSAFAMAHQDVRFFLNGLLLKLAKQHIETAATDGHRLAKNVLSYAESLPERQCILPKKTVQELCKHLQESDSLVHISLGKQHISFISESLELYSNLIEGDYPDYEKLLPREFAHRAVIDVALLKSSLQRMITLANEKYHGASLNFSDSKLTLSANNINHEEANDELNIVYTGEPVKVGLNIHYVQELLQVVETETIEIGIVNTEKSITFTELDSSNQSQFIVMPLTL